MAELTNKVEADLVLDRKMDAGRYCGGDLHNYVASQELTVTITLSEYRELVSGIATKDKDISIANDGKFQREQEIKEVRAANDALKAENYDLKVKLDQLREACKNNEAAIEALKKQLEKKEKQLEVAERMIEDLKRPVCPASEQEGDGPF